MSRGIALVLFCVALPAGVAADELDDRLKSIFAGDALKAKAFDRGRWIRGGAGYTTLEDSVESKGAKDIVEYETATGKRSVLVSAVQLTPVKAARPLSIDDYAWDKDLNRLLIFTESRKTWRTNTRGDYWVLDRVSGGLRKLGGDAPASSLQFAKFSPDGGRVAYVRRNNLYVEDVSTGKVRALTKDGSETIINGTSDWVYEEELNLRDGFRWSPDGTKIAYWRFDVSGVEQFTLINNTEGLYPVLTRFPYPKAGGRNSAVKVGVVGAAGGAARWLAIPGDPREHYIFRMDWTRDGRSMAVAQLNRKQNRATVFLADPRSGAAKAVFEDRDEAWVDAPEGSGAALGVSGFEWVKGGDWFVWLSERDSWRRAYAVPLAGGEATAVSAEGVDAMALAAMDRRSGALYYVASPENPVERHLYLAALERGSPPVRVSPQDQPGSHSYDVSPDGRWAFHTYSRFDRPPLTDLISLPDHRSVRVLEENGALRAAVAPLVEPPVEFLQLNLGDGVTVDGWLLKPPAFDPAKKYPLIVYVYGEPWTATVVDQWGESRMLFHRALADAGYLVASFDNRGTPTPKGRAWRKSIYGAVGVLSTKDQTEAVQALVRERSYVDPARVGVWGWSGGGSNTLNLMFRSPEVFLVGVSVAPVPDQRLYDTIYQERYMGLPQENEDGYRRGSPIHFAEGLKGKLLIVHGSGDDNVHYQGTEKLINRLIELGRPFDMMEYPNRSHAISEGPGTTLHVYSLIARYFRAYLAAGPK